jgi:antirestriction protein ArdC
VREPWLAHRRGIPVFPAPLVQPGDPPPRRSRFPLLTSVSPTLAGRVTRPLRWNGTPYSGINVIMLWSEAMAGGYGCPIWMTCKQAAELGGQVRKGEHGSLVVHADRITRTETDTDTGQQTKRAIPFMKGYTVFNCEQVDGLPADYYGQPAPQITSTQRIQNVDRYFAATRATIRHGGNQAYYAIGADIVQMPPFECFRDPESYYAALAHEMTHWTRHP